MSIEEAGVGGIVAVFGEPDSELRATRLAAMTGAAPYRGAASVLQHPGLSLGVQVNNQDAALGQHGNLSLALFGVITDWGRYHQEAVEALACPATRLAGLLRRHAAEQVFAELNGHFSCVWFDGERGELLAARDICATRPLYMGVASGRLVMASEIRQVLAGLPVSRRLNADYMAELVAYGGIVSRLDETPYAGVERLIGGRIYRWSTGQAPPRCTDYWTPASVMAYPLPKSEWSQALRDAIDGAVKRLIPDAPFAVSLSGGVDSSTIWASLGVLEQQGVQAAARRHALTLSMPGLACDESALVTENLRRYGGTASYVDISGRRLSEELPTLLDQVDFPHGGLMVGYDAVFERYREHGIRVELNGFGADNLLMRSRAFLGDLFWAGRFDDWWRCTRCDWQAQGMAAAGRGLSRKLLATVLPRSLRQRLGGLRWRGGPGGMLHAQHRAIVKARLACSRVNLAQYGVFGVDVVAAWRGILSGQVLDANEPLYARAGVELRLPFLDKAFVELAFSLGDLMVCEGPRQKAVMRDAMGGRLPQAILDQPPVYYADFYARDLGWRHDPLPLSSWQLFERRLLDWRVFQRRVLREADTANRRMTPWYYPMECFLRTFDD